MTTCRCGFIGIIGRPNVGKSTFINAIIGEKVSIISPKPQTTRNRIVGILTSADYQLVFFDTPGIIQRPRNRLQQIMVDCSLSTIGQTDGLLVIIDAVDGITRADHEIILLTKSVKGGIFAVLNKIDLVEKSRLLPLIDELAKMNLFSEIIPISALKQDGLDLLIPAILPCISVGDRIYDPDMYTDLPVRFLASEIVREKLFLNLDLEIPYGIAVVIEGFSEEDDKVVIDAVIHVDKQNHKKIVVGKGGAMIKRIGTSARKEIRDLLERPVHLGLFVKVSPGWFEKPQKLAELGYRN